MGDQNLLRPGSKIVIKAEGTEEMEEIELDEEATHFLAQFVERNGGNQVETGDGDGGEVITGDVIDLCAGIEGHQDPGDSQSQQPCSSASADGNTYIINSDTGEIQLIQVTENVPGVGRGGEEVEVVTIDSNSLLVDDGDEGGGTQGQNQPLIQYNAFLDQLRNMAKPKVSRRGGGLLQQTQRTSSKVVPPTRMKSAPALLRNSRRVAATSTVPAPGSSGGGGGDKNSASSAKPLRKTGHSAVTGGLSNAKSLHQIMSVPSTSGQITMLDGRAVGKVEEYEDPLEQPQEVYYIYQNADGEQVAQIVDNSSGPSFLSTASMNILCQFENNQMLLRQGEILGGLSIAPPPNPKAPKSPKKKPLKKSRPPTTAPKKESKKKPANKKSMAELKCMEKGCSKVTYNILELRKHLTNEHDMPFDSETVKFPSDAAFKEWRDQYERERMVSFIYRGGTKKISKEQAVTYLICHRSGHYKPTMNDESKRKRKMKPQGSCKIGGYCTAGIKLLKNLSTEEVLMDICHTHYGHPLDSEAIPHLRVNPVLRKIILNKFERGMTFPEMLAYIHHNPDRLEGLRMVDRRAVRNIYDTWRAPRQKKTSEDVIAEDVLKPEVPNNAASQMVSDAKHNDNDDGMVEMENLEIGDPAHDEQEEMTKIFLHQCAEKSKNKTDKADDDPEASSEISDGESGNSDFYSEEKNSDEDAPILLPMDEEMNEECSNDDDLSLPVLVAVESVTSPKPHQSVKRKKERTRKNDGKRRKLSGGLKVKVEKVAVKNQDEDQSLSLEDSVDNLENDQEDDFGMMNIQISPELEATIHKLHNHGESGPTILLYKPVGSINVKYGDFCRAFREDDFCLIIQTPVQRQILQMFPKVINFEILDKAKPNEQDLKLGYLSVLDDYREAIPVAWIVADSFCPRILNQLFKTLRYHCGELPIQYLMVPKNTEVLKSWTSHFSHKPKIIQSEFSARRELRTLLNRNIPNGKVRNKASAILDEMINKKCPDSLKDLKETLIKITKTTPNGPAYLRKMEKDWLSRMEEWSLAYRTTRTSCNLLFASESFGKLRKFVSFKGSKQLTQTVDHILKIGYDKCFVRSKRMFKGDQKFSRLLEKLDEYHDLAKDKLKDAKITGDPEDDCKWTVTREEDDEEESKAEVYELKSPCDCKIICKRCRICMHAYLCSCKDFTEGHTMCAHIHKVHRFREGKSMEEEAGRSKEEMVVGVHKEQSSLKSGMPPQEDLATGRSGQIQEAVICEDGTEITFVSDDQLAALNLTEVLQAASGLFGQQQNEGGGEIPKIVSITDADDDKIIYEGEGEIPVIFRF